MVESGTLEHEEMSPLHSTLELLEHDLALAVPERDNTAVRIGHDVQSNAPGTAPASGPEIGYSKSPPEAVVIPKRKGSTPQSTANRHLSPRAIIFITAVITSLIIGSSVGIGVGVGVGKKRSPGSGSSVVDASTITMTATAGPRPTLVLTDRQILNDTSIAALGLPNGNRQLFFQDLSGAIRQAIYSINSRGWRADVEYVVASDAKKNTPLAVVDTPNASHIDSSAGRRAVSNVTQIGFGGLTVFYITANDTLVCAMFQDGAWLSLIQLAKSGTPYFANISRYAANVGSRHLSVVIDSDETPFRVLLFYEAIHGKITVLSGSLPLSWFTQDQDPLATTIKIPRWIWKNSTHKLLTSRDNTYPEFAAPFSTEPLEGTALFAGKHPNGSYSSSALEVIYAPHGGINNGTPSNFFTSVLTESFNPSSIQESDLLRFLPPNAATEELLLYGFWVNGQTLLGISNGIFKSLPSMPKSLFPFKRLAGVSPTNGTSFYVYHQMNASHFMEEQYDAAISGWISHPFPILMN